MILKRFLVLMFVLAISFNCFSQNNITGKWEGMFLSRSTDLGAPRLVIEVFDFKDSLFTGITHLYYRGNKYEHYRMQGRYLEKDSMIVFFEASTIAVDLGIYGNCLGMYMMKLKKEAGYLTLDGIWIANIPGCTDNVQVQLSKKFEEPKKKTQPVKKPVIKKPEVKNKTIPPVNPIKRDKVISEKPEAPIRKDIPDVKIKTVTPPVIKNRETDLQSLLEIDVKDKDSIRVDIYDNAEIDGDYVSVYEDDVQRIANKKITTTPITFYVSLNKQVNPLVHLRLVAESMGTIPPCTALMIVTTKSKRYEVHLSSNFKKNATVELFLKE